MCLIFSKFLKLKSPFTLYVHSYKGMSSAVKKPFTILVEGNIGSGKSTFLNNFSNNNNVLTVYEPIKEWKNVGDVDLMTSFYEDPKKWAFTFQSHIMLTMMKAHETATSKSVKIMERSIYSGRYVFIQNLADMNLITKPEFAVLDEWYNYLITSGTFSVDLIVYLKTDPEVAFSRLKNRGRIAEDRLTIDYLRKLHKCYEDWLFGRNEFICPAPVMCLNANNDIETVRHEYNYYENQMNFC